ncbi:MAG TPA: asparagine synthase (glutamine-hydrolyzing) [Nitrospiraceae bacterium]|nr:asparagine synthase (glutamine-hydrolyzing) [Nitrospiraceae bacterium]
MCGIAGNLHLDGASASQELLSQMIGTIRYRGPDDVGIYRHGPVGLAHARLSIIDLAGGHQPMSIANDSLWITFNGEIFNYIELREDLIKKGHRFTSSSDTEVLLHLYQEEGTRCVERLNGQWAFAVWDATKRALFLSRDRFGVRPLFYTQTGNTFLFASEIKALLACPEVESAIDLTALDQIFTFWVTVPPRTAFKNIKQLPPGHSMIIQDGRITIHPYWTLDLAPSRDFGRASEKSLAEELLALLRDATEIRLRSDVPVGAYLSGGIDSTVITALAGNHVGNKLRTFSIGFDDSEFDETSYQREASSFLGTLHSDIRCTHQDISRIFPDVVWHAEQPIIRTAPAPLYLLSKLVHDSGFKVVLTGEGADELLGGYDIFKETKVREFWSRWPTSSWRPLLLKRLYPYMDNIQRQSLDYLKHFFHVTEHDVKSPFFSHLPRWTMTAKSKQFFSKSTKSDLGSYNGINNLLSELPERYSSWSPFSRAEFLEAQYLLPGYILSSQGDRMAMAHAVEGRYPFLDHRVVEFATTVPVGLKMKVLDQKHLLKQAVKGLIPESIRTRHKQPYRAPDGRSFFGHKDCYVQEALSPARIKEDGIFDPTATGALVEKFQSGRDTGMKDNMALIGILSTTLLIDQFIRGRGRLTSLSPPYERPILPQA